MRSRLGLVLTAGLTAALLLPAPGGSGPRVVRALAGTVTLATLELSQRCGAKPGGTPEKKILAVSCSQIGAFAGKPARAGASYAWTWALEVGADNRTTGKGPETGKLGLNFGSGAIVYLATKGLQLPVPGGTPGVKSQAKTTGTWKVTKGGTGTYAKATGSGTYTFSTTFENGTTFTVAKITLRGTIR